MDGEKSHPPGAENFRWTSDRFAGRPERRNAPLPADRHDIEGIFGSVTRAPREGLFETPLEMLAGSKFSRNAAPALEKSRYEQEDDAGRRRENPEALIKESLIMRKGNGSQVLVERSLDGDGKLRSVTVRPYGENAQDYPALTMKYNEKGDIAEAFVTRIGPKEVESVSIDPENKDYRLWEQLDALELDRGAMSEQNRLTKERDKGWGELDEYIKFMASGAARSHALEAKWSRTRGPMGEPSGKVTYRWIDSETGREGVESISAEEMNAVEGRAKRDHVEGDVVGHHGWKIFIERHPEFKPLPKSESPPAA